MTPTIQLHTVQSALLICVNTFSACEQLKLVWQVGVVDKNAQFVVLVMSILHKEAASHCIYTKFVIGGPAVLKSVSDEVYADRQIDVQVERYKQSRYPLWMHVCGVCFLLKTYAIVILRNL